MTNSKRSLEPATELVDRFRAGLGPFAQTGTKLGLAVSGGPDSVAMLLLAAAARPGEIEAATVDHGLRAEARAEAEAVAALCEKLGVPHSILTAEWEEKPETGVPAKARQERYRLLGKWARDRGIGILLVGHHADDQAETFLMRLNRGAGLKGLAGMRRITGSPVGGRIAIVRPLLGWRQSELEQICADAGVTPAADPTNDDDQFERTRVRQALASADWLDRAAIARSARHIAQADAALHYATTQEWLRAVTNSDGSIVYTPGNAPPEIRRRVARRAVLQLASEAPGIDLRGRELDQLMALLMAGRKATLRGVLCSGGKRWRFAKAPARRAVAAEAQA